MKKIEREISSYRTTTNSTSLCYLLLMLSRCIDITNDLA